MWYFLYTALVYWVLREIIFQGPRNVYPYFFRLKWLLHVKSYSKWGLSVSGSTIFMTSIFGYLYVHIDNGLKRSRWYIFMTLYSLSYILTIFYNYHRQLYFQRLVFNSSYTTPSHLSCITGCAFSHLSPKFCSSLSHNTMSGHIYSSDILMNSSSFIWVGIIICSPIIYVTRSHIRHVQKWGVFHLWVDVISVVHHELWVVHLYDTIIKMSQEIQR
jgi:hypothetical protein